MTLRCRCCDNIIGVRFPYIDQSIDRDSMCTECAAREHVGVGEADTVNVRRLQADEPTDLEIPCLPRPILGRSDAVGRPNVTV
jgi:hypothetical protein